jgi:hypothetical protein
MFLLPVLGRPLVNRAPAMSRRARPVWRAIGWRFGDHHGRVFRFARAVGG